MSVHKGGFGLNWEVGTLEHTSRPFKNKTKIQTTISGEMMTYKTHFLLTATSAFLHTQ